VLVVGLTGGIGSGKSSVSERLQARGAVVIDADRITRELQEPGQPVLAAMVDRFGSDIVGDDGRLDRQRVADLVFADPDAKADLEAIVHPAVGVAIAERMAAAGPDDIVVLDIPLLVEKGRDDLAATIVVDVDPEVAVERLVTHRGFTEADARARMAHQASRADRLAKADVVVDNSGTLADLDAEVERLWAWLGDLAAAPPA
jgi:dephospho-CoA kinase